MVRIVYTKAFFVTILMFMSILVKSQNNEISLVVTGEGKDKQEATFVALRDAIEQTFGTFISSNTTILNDKLIQDEIVSISTGNILGYDYLSETKLPSGNLLVTIKAKISINKLTSFCENKGVNVEFKGALFAMNIKQKELNKSNEEKVITTMINQLTQICTKVFDYKISVSEPKEWNGQRMNQDSHEPGYVCVATVDLYPNSNAKLMEELFSNTLQSLSLTEIEIEDYKKNETRTFQLSLNDKNKFVLRSEKSIEQIEDFINEIFVQKAIFGFQIKDNNQVSNLEGIYISKLCGRCGSSSSISEIGVYPLGSDNSTSSYEIYLGSKSRNTFNGRLLQKHLWDNIDINRVNSKSEQRNINGTPRVFYTQNIPVFMGRSIKSFDFVQNSKQYSIQLDLFIGKDELMNLTGFSVESKN